MLIKMRTTSAGPEGVRLVGSVHDLKRSEAVMLIEGGYATPVRDGEQPEIAVVQADEGIEKAVVEPLPKWRLRQSPVDYLKKNPEGPKAELARRYVEAEGG